ncbi:MAG: lysophospholipid acyltransferase family protein, partial [Myxococcota bacterium]
MGLLHRIDVDPQVAERLAQLDVRDDGYGVDAFGLDRSWLPLGLALTRGLYRHWFRVESRGHENLPRSGAGIVAANHSGTLPFDASMLWADILRKSNPPRLGRAVADQFVANLPFVSTLFARTGAIGSSRGNLERVLERGDLVIVFPEGTPGIGKRFSERYKLQRWRVGHVELALRHRVPVIPTAIVGAEEQMPQV